MSEQFFTPSTAIMLLLVAFVATCCAFIAAETQPLTHKGRNWAITASILWYGALVAHVTTTRIATSVALFCLAVMVPVLLHRVRHPRSKLAATNPIFIDEDNRFKW